MGYGSIGIAHQGWSASISGDGNTAIVGGYCDNPTAAGHCRGAAWIFARTGAKWAQQGAKLVGLGAGYAGLDELFGWSVAISADGNTALVGGYNDNGAGAAWVFARCGGAWTQQYDKLVGNGAVGHARQGRSVALSSDGSTAIVGGDEDNGLTGAAWIFAWSAPASAATIPTLHPLSVVTLCGVLMLMGFVVLRQRA